MHWLVDDCVCRVTGFTRLPRDQVSVQLINNCSAVGSRVGKVTPVVHYQVRTVPGSTRTRAGGGNV